MRTTEFRIGEDTLTVGTLAAVKGAVKDAVEKAEEQ
jgi:hypothetical protein